MTKQHDDKDKWRMLFITSMAMIGALTSWLAATAVLENLADTIGITLQQAAWLTNAVQLGFVAGALSSSFVSLTDTVSLSRTLTLSSLLAALSTAALLIEPSLTVALAARFVTGVALAGVYPTAMKLIATWFIRGRGLALGIMVGAITLGSAMPYFFRAIGGGTSWQMVISVSVLACLMASVVFATLIKEGPHGFAPSKFDPRQLSQVLRNKPVMLANLGYFGHMWELYAMWGWILAYASAAHAAGQSLINASLLAFMVVAVGAIGCLVGGFLSDRIGRCLTTSLMMTISGICALLIGLLFNGPTTLFVLVALIWGFTVVADSAQFSTAVSELSPNDFVGSSLAFQMAVGFAITMFTIWLVPVIAGIAGSWRWTFLILVPGPLVGIIAMMKLRTLPEAAKLAGGRR